MCRRRPALEGLARTVPAAPHRCRHWEPPAGVSSARWSAACEAGHHLALCEAPPLVARRWAQCSSAAARHEAPRHTGAGASAATGPLSASRWPGPRPAALRGQPGGSSRWPLRVQTTPQTREVLNKDGRSSRTGVQTREESAGSLPCFFIAVPLCWVWGIGIAVVELPEGS